MVVQKPTYKKRVVGLPGYIYMLMRLLGFIDDFPLNKMVVDKPGVSKISHYLENSRCQVNFQKPETPKTSHPVAQNNGTFTMFSRYLFWWNQT